MNAHARLARKTDKKLNFSKSSYQVLFNGSDEARKNGNIKKGKLIRTSFKPSFRFWVYSNPGRSKMKIPQSNQAALLDLNRSHLFLKSASSIQFPTTKNWERLINSNEKGRPTTIRSRPVKCKYG